MWFKRRGVTVECVQTDNGSAFTSGFSNTKRDLAIPSPGFHQTTSLPDLLSNVFVNPTANGNIINEDGLYKNSALLYNKDKQVISANCTANDVAAGQNDSNSPYAMSNDTYAFSCDAAEKLSGFSNHALASFAYAGSSFLERESEIS